MKTQIVLEHGWVLALGVPLLLTALLLWVRTGRQRGIGWRRLAILAGLRTCVLLLLLLLVSLPVRVFPQPELPTRDGVALLIDRSASMSLEGEREDRYRQAIGFLSRELLPAMKTAGLKVHAYLFSDEAVAASGTEISAAAPDGKQTNLARAISQAVTQDKQPPLAVVALTDGIATVTTDNARGATALVENRVPFFAVGFGEETGRRILSLDEADAPRVVSPRQKFQIAIRLRMTGTASTPPFGLTLLRDGQFAQQKTISPGSGARVWQESFQVMELDEGLHSYTVRLLPPADPAIRCPRIEATLAVRSVGEQLLRVLFVQGGLTWDYKFIRLALSGDPSVQLSSLSRAASGSTFMQSDASGADEAGLAGGFPSTIQQLASFRVIVLSNLKPGDLPPAQQDLLAQFCGELGGGVLMIGGASTFDATWQDSRLEQLLAVKFSASSRRPGDGQPFRLRVTDEALRHPIFQISDAADHRGAWEALPTFRHYAPVDSVKPGARVWAVGKTPGRSAPEPVLIASQRYGAGLTAVICLQNLWRWRLAQSSNPRHFDRFWQQFLRYLGEGSRDKVVLRLPDQQLQPREELRVFLQRRPDPRFESNDRDPYRFRVVDADAQPIADQTVELAAGQSAEVSFTVPQPGLYQASVVDRQGAVAAFRSLDIRDVDTELLYTARNMDHLRQWASLCGGKAIRFEDCESPDQLVDQIQASFGTPRRQRPVRRPLGVNGWMLAILLGCLCVEWVARKRWGLV